MKVCVGIVKNDKVRCELRQNVFVFQRVGTNGAHSETGLGAGDAELNDSAVGTAHGLHGHMSSGRSHGEKKLAVGNERNIVSRAGEVYGVSEVDETEEETGWYRQEQISLDTTPRANLGPVVCHPILSFRLPCAVVVIASQWRCWIIPVLALRLPLAGTYFPRSMHHLFQVPLNWSKPKLMDSWSTYEDF